jgi:hypothetical protein
MFDLILIGGGGLVWAHTGVWANVRSWTRGTPPVAVAGLGVNKITDLLEPELNALIDESRLFLVRDQRSHELLDRNPQVAVMPDLSWAFPYTECASSEKRGIGVNLCQRIGVSANDARAILQNLDCVPVPLHMGSGEDVCYLREALSCPVASDRGGTPHEYGW